MVLRIHFFLIFYHNVDKCQMKQLERVEKAGHSLTLLDGGFDRKKKKKKRVFDYFGDSTGPQCSQIKIMVVLKILNSCG